MVLGKAVGDLVEAERLYAGKVNTVTEAKEGEEKPTRASMEATLREWGVLPEGPGKLPDAHLERRYQVFSNIDYGSAPS